MMKNLCFLLCVWLILPKEMHAQAQDANFLIDKQSNIPLLPKNIQKKEQKALNTEQSYQLKIFPQQFSLQMPALKALEMPKDSSKAFLRHTLSLAYGNYGTWQAKAFLSKIFKKNTWAAHLDIGQSPRGDVAFQENSQQMGKVIWKIHQKNWTLRNNLATYAQQSFFYGKQNDQVPRQSFFKISLESYLEKYNKGNWHWTSQNRFYVWQNQQPVNESVWQNSTHISYQKTWHSTNEIFYRLENNDFILQNHFYYQKNNKHFFYQIGGKMAYQAFLENNKVLFFPQLHLKYKIIPDKLGYHFGIGGGYTPNTLADLSEKNPFLFSPLVKHGLQNFSFEHSFFYQFLQIFYLQVQHKFEKVQNQVFFWDKPDASFDLVYDNISRQEISFLARMEYDNLKLRLFVQENIFSLSQLAQPYHQARRRAEIELSQELGRHHFSLFWKQFWDITSTQTQWNLSQIGGVWEGKLHKNWHLGIRGQYFLSEKRAFFEAYPLRKLEIDLQLKWLF